MKILFVIAPYKRKKRGRKLTLATPEVSRIQIPTTLEEVEAESESKWVH